jgi:hypothetical protein
MSEKEPVPEKGLEKTWYICSEQEEIKNKLMNLIVKLRLKKQHKVGLWLRKNNPPKKATISNLMPSPPSSSDTISVKNTLDGYWVLLQDWSSCSKKCGGGVQFQHLMCVPPKNGGKPCEGEALRQKSCNQQPCPSVSDAEKVLPQKGKEKINDPIIKMLPISSRPLRYDKCHIKEGDTLFTAHKPGVGIENNPEKLPSRVVMNEKTISVYTNENLETLLATFVLEKTVFKVSSRDNKCFILDSEIAKGEFCKLSNESKINFFEEWNYDFHLFKIQCRTERDVVELNNKEEKELSDELEKKIDSAKLDVIKERTKRIQKKVEEAPINKVDKLQETAMLAMKKELAIDGLLQKEEMDREEAEIKEMKLQYESEKKKDECLMKSIKEKEIEDQYNLNKIQQDKELNELKEQVKLQILQKRKQVKMKIMQMRKRASRKKKAYQDEIQTLRMQVAGQLNKSNREGNLNECFKPTNSEDDKKKVLKYCNTHFSDSSPNKFKECLSEDFCYTCCENEFGELFVKQRESCYDKCEQVNQKTVKAGSWQWSETVE